MSSWGGEGTILDPKRRGGKAPAPAPVQTPETSTAAASAAAADFDPEVSGASWMSWRKDMQKI